MGKEESFNEKERVEIKVLDSELFLNSNIEGKYSENKYENAALHYASLGLKVVPLYGIETKEGSISCSCKLKEKCGAGGKHPRTAHGHKQATNELGKLRWFWKQYPNAHPGIRTGFESKIVVLDIDPKNGGDDSFNEIQEKYKSLLGENYEPIPETLTAITGSDGRHIYFKFPKGLREIGGSVNLIASGLDIRANENYVVAPPSLHLSGGKYSWIGRDTPIKEMPNWLLYEIARIEEDRNKKSEKADSTPAKKESAKKEVSPVSVNGKIPNGMRNEHLKSIVGRFVSKYSTSASYELALEKLLEENSSLFHPPLKEGNIRKTVKWCWKKHWEKKW